MMIRVERRTANPEGDVDCQKKGDQNYDGWFAFPDRDTRRTCQKSSKYRLRATAHARMPYNANDNEDAVYAKIWCIAEISERRKGNMDELTSRSATHIRQLKRVVMFKPANSAATSANVQKRQPR